MKKSVIFLLLCIFSVSIPTFAANVPEPTPEPREVAVVEDHYGEEPVYPTEIRLSDGEAGRGSVEYPDKHWAANGYPDYISFAYEAGGELLDDGTVVSWWEIGIIGGEPVKQMVLDLVAPSCRVTFWERTFSYNQREAAYSEILARNDENIHGAVMQRNGEGVFVEIAEGYEKEYARQFIEQYGYFVGVTNSLSAMDDAMTGGGMEMGGNPGDPFGVWPWLLAAICLAGITLLAVRRFRLVPALQTTNGTIVTSGAKMSVKEVESAIRNSSQVPADDVFDAIRKEISPM